MKASLQDPPKKVHSPLWFGLLTSLLQEGFVFFSEEPLLPDADWLHGLDVEIASSVLEIRVWSENIP